MQFHRPYTPAEEASVPPHEFESVDIDAFIEAQLKTGVLIANIGLPMESRPPGDTRLHSGAGARAR